MTVSVVASRTGGDLPAGEVSSVRMTEGCRLRLRNKTRPYSIGCGQRLPLFFLLAIRILMMMMRTMIYRAAAKTAAHTAVSSMVVDP